MAEMENKELSFAEFEELYLQETTFAKKLEVSEAPTEPKNLKDRRAQIANYTQDSVDQFSKDTQEINKLLEEFELKWNGPPRQPYESAFGRGGLSDTTKIEFSWMKDMFMRYDATHKKMLGRAVQDRALLLAELISESEELARLYGTPEAIVMNMKKDLEVHYATMKKGTEQMEKIMGQLKLGDEGKKR